MASDRTAAWTTRESLLRGPYDMGAPMWLDVGGVRTRYFDQGTGAPVVFVHGGTPGSDYNVTDSIYWDLNVAPLATQMNCIAFDRLGQGATDNPKVDADYTMSASVRHATMLLRQLRKGPYHLVGHSRGGFLVCRLAFEHPSLVKTCTIIASGTLSPGVNRTAVHLKNPPLPLKSRESMRWILERGCYQTHIVTDSWLDECVSVAASEREKAAVTKMVHERLNTTVYGIELRKQRSETYRWILERGMPCPTLLVWGLNDPTAEFDNAKLLIEMMMRTQSKTEVRIFDKAGHFVFREQAEGFNGMLHDYVKQYS